MILIISISSNNEIKEKCEAIEGDSKKHISYLYNLLAVIGDPIYNYDQQVQMLQNIYYNNSDLFQTGRQNFYIMCNHMSWFRTSRDIPDPVQNKIPSEYFIKKCSDVFGEQYTEQHIRDGNNRTNLVFGGNRVRMGHKVFFIYSDSDPNQLIGPYEANTENLNLLIVPNVGRFFGLRPGTTAGELEAEEKIHQFIGQWTK